MNRIPNLRVTTEEVFEEEEEEEEEECHEDDVKSKPNVITTEQKTITKVYEEVFST